MAYFSDQAAAERYIAGHIADRIKLGVSPSLFWYGKLELLDAKAAYEKLGETTVVKSIEALLTAYD